MNKTFRFNYIAETRNCLLGEIEQNELVSRKPEKVSTTLNYIEHFLFLASANTECTSGSAFAFLIGIPIAITSSVIGLKIFAITAGVRQYKSIIKIKKDKHDRIVLLAKSKLNNTKILTSKAIIDSIFGHDEFFFIQNVLKCVMV